MSSGWERPSIETIRAEFAVSGLTGRVWHFMEEVLQPYVRRRLPRRYSRLFLSLSGSWDDESTSDLVRTFLVEKPESVASALARSSSTEGAVRYLERCLHNFLIDRSRSVRENIFKRLRRVMASDTELTCFNGSGGDATFGLTEWRDAPPQPMMDEGLFQLARYFPPDIKWQNYETDSRESPGISSGDLGSIAKALIVGGGRLLSPFQVMRLIIARFPLADPEFTSTDDEAGEIIVEKSPSPLDDLVAQEAASKLVSVLSARQLEILRLWVCNDKDQGVRQSGQAIGIGKTTASKERRAIVAVFQALRLSTHDEKAQVLRILAKEFDC